MAGLGRSLAIVALFLALAAATTRADEAARAKILELNRITGADPLQGAMKELQSDKELTKNLIAEGLTLTKSKKNGLAYNGALLLALAAAERKDFTASEAFFRICMDQAAKLQSPRRLLQSYRGLIDLYYENKKYEESARVCRELLELKTDDGKERIVLFAAPGRFGETDFYEDDKFDSAAQLRPFFHRQLIKTITRQGKHDQALKLAEALIKASKSNWFEVQLKGWVLREAGRLEEAAAVYEDVVVRVAKDPELKAEEKTAYQKLYKYLLSGVYVDLKQLDKASEQLEWLIQKEPDDPGYNNDLGYIWADHDMKLDEAEKLIKKALELDRKRRKANPELAPEEDRDNGAYLDSLGWVYFKQKKYKEAKEVLLKAVEDKNSQHIEIYDHLGDVNLELGEREAALAAWRKGLEVVGEGRRDMTRKESVQKKSDKHKTGN